MYYCIICLYLLVTVATVCVGGVQYSEKLRKVFIRFDAFCPFLFSSSCTTPRGCVIRAMPKFIQLKHVNDVVRRCPHHATMSASNSGDGVPPADHLIRCEHRKSVYVEDAVTGFHSVLVPYGVPSGTTQVYQQSIIF